MTGMTPPRAAGFAAAALATVAAVAGCGSSGAATPAQARSEVLSAYHLLYDQHLYGARVGHAHSIQGSYQGCKGNKSDTMYVGVTSLYPFHRMSTGTFARAVSGEMRRSGWTLRQQKPPVQTSTAVSYYVITKGPVTGDMYAYANGTASAQMAMGVNSQCFSSGSLKPSMVHFDNFPLPHPAATP
jgi:hypothetical protein